jgi:hypothetical protein
MAIIQGRYVDHAKVFVDECSKTRHFLARLKLVRHEGTYLTMREYWQREYDHAPSSYPRLVK